MKVGLAQVNGVVGDFAGNAKRILGAYRDCLERGAELVVTPEMSLVGYPPRDLVFKSQFVPKCLQALDYLAGEVKDVPLLVGYVDFHGGEKGKPYRNAAAWLEGGEGEDEIFQGVVADV
jgi:NAD+ synthase (glutamine-hydrolysing)